MIPLLLRLQKGTVKNAGHCCSLGRPLGMRRGRSHSKAEGSAPSTSRGTWAPTDRMATLYSDFFSLAAQSMVCPLAALISPGSLLELQNLRSHPDLLSKLPSAVVHTDVTVSVHSSCRLGLGTGWSRFQPLEAPAGDVCGQMAPTSMPKEMVTQHRQSSCPHGTCTRPATPSGPSRWFPALYP